MAATLKSIDYNVAMTFILNNNNNNNNSNCPKKRSLPRCVFVANGLRCTDMCRLAECENRAFTSDIEESCIADVEDFENFDDY